ncbi:hypothetical protein Cgig2_022710 [Carnegiea gigantea]|uniref:Uncharacterized protein n=1 Tax=Carnegiea gigantea TaxID=171969 RepID=A0A9Q1QDB0_9CARY|nr:hypothetical protein Cgig2_022710 [Carnegiea gigantea]
MGIPSTSAFGLEDSTVIAGSGAKNEANNGGTSDEEMDDAMPELTRVSKTVVTMTPLKGPPPKASYSAMVPQNDPNLNFSDMDMDVQGDKGNVSMTSKVASKTLLTFVQVTGRKTPQHVQSTNTSATLKSGHQHHSSKLLLKHIGVVYGDALVDKHPRKDEVRVKHFCTTPQNILMEIKDNPMLKRPRPI